jgi:hypothetical protein
LSSSDWAKAGWASDTPASIATIENDALGMIRLPFSQTRQPAGIWTGSLWTCYTVSAALCRFRHEIGNVL